MKRLKLRSIDLNFEGGLQVSFISTTLDSNHHGTERKGEPWNKETVRGWKAKWLVLEGFDRNSKLKQNIGRRLIIYRPSGACWLFDVCWSTE
jgi:hypothetical protein